MSDKLEENQKLCYGVKGIGLAWFWSTCFFIHVYFICNTSPSVKDVNIAYNIYNIIFRR